MGLETAAGRRQDIPLAINLALVVGHAALLTFVYFGVPLLVQTVSPIWGWLVVPAVLMTPNLWAVMHEAFHGILHPDRGINDGIGRVLSILFAAPYRVLRFGHLMHHALSRTSYDRPEVYRPERDGRLRFTIVYYTRLLIGLYGAEFLSSLFALLPRSMVRRLVRATFCADEREAANLPDRAERALAQGRNLVELRIDGLAILVLLAASAWAYGAYWPILAASVVGRGLFISLLDNAPHYGTRLDDRGYALNMSVPHWCQPLLLHFNLHRVHHRNPTKPWRALPRLADSSDPKCEISYVRAAMRQLKGPIPLNMLEIRPFR